MPPTTFLNKQNRRNIIVAVILVAALYILVPQLSAFRSSVHLLRHPDIHWLVVATALTFLSYVAGAGTYFLLAFRPLLYGQVLLVQLAAMFINRLLPAGIGAVGINYAYLHRSRHSAAQAAGVVATNNLLGFVGHGLLIVITFISFASQVAANSAPHPSLPGGWLLIGLVVIILSGVALITAKGRLKRFFYETTKQLLSYRQRPERLGLALATSIALTLCNVMCFASCAMALGVNLSLPVVVLIFTFGVGAGVATPTPGGLGGFEAGLVAGMVANHIASPLALAVALLYRLVSYWLPLVVGGLAFLICQRRQLFSAP